MGAGSRGDFKRGICGADIVGAQFTRILNSAVRDSRLSRRARGLLAELLSHSEDFVITIASLTAAGPEGKDALRSALKELERYGYLTRDRARNDKGHLQGAQWRFTDLPGGIESLVRTFTAAGETGRSEPTAGNPPQAAQPTAGKPAADFPTQAEPAHKKTTFEEDQAFVARERASQLKEDHSLSPDPSPGIPEPARTEPRREVPAAPERESAAPEKQQGEAEVGAKQVLAAYEDACASRGRRLSDASRERVWSQAAKILSGGFSQPLVDHLVRLVADMASRGWTDLEKHLEKNPLPAVAAGASVAGDDGDRWPLSKCPHCFGSSWRTTEDDREVKCDHSRAREVRRGPAVPRPDDVVLPGRKRKVQTKGADSMAKLDRALGRLGGRAAS